MSAPESRLHWFTGALGMMAVTWDIPDPVFIGQSSRH